MRTIRRPGEGNRQYVEFARDFGRKASRRDSTAAANLGRATISAMVGHGALGSGGETYGRRKKGLALGADGE